jgi:hypothetical protein
MNAEGLMKKYVQVQEMGNTLSLLSPAIPGHTGHVPSRAVTYVLTDP